MTIQQEILTALLKKFPKAGSLTIAKRAYRENPAIWRTLESARTSVRHLRGASGEQGKNRPVREFFKPVRKAGEGTFAALPRGLTHFHKWESFKIDGPARALVLGDLHIPYHDDVAVVAALAYGLEHRANLILLNGDIADFFSCSFWEKDPRKRRFKDEIEAVRSFLSLLRENFPRARIVYKLGNHEERWERYMRVKAPELLDVEDFDIAQMLRLEKLKIELVSDKRPISLGMLNLLHGHEYRFAISGPVNPARGIFLRAKVHCIVNHFHQTSQHSEKNLEEHVTSSWSVGCLCDLHPDYDPLNKWNHGFAFVEVDGTGKFHVTNPRIIKGKVY